MELDRAAAQARRGSSRLRAGRLGGDLGQGSRQNSGGWAPEMPYFGSRMKNGTPWMPMPYPCCSSSMTASRLSSPVSAASTPSASRPPSAASFSSTAAEPMSSASSK